MIIPQSNLFDGFSILPSIFVDMPSHFSLDMSGALAGLFGGDDALSAMTTVVYGDKRWLGWYNTPGSFHIFKRLGSFANSLSSKNFDSEHIDVDPATLFKSSACKGPKFCAAHSGTIIEETGYLAALFSKECAIWESEGRVVPGRKTQPIRITLADIDQEAISEMRLGHPRASTLFFASIPIAVSVGTCALCAVYGDWYACSLILVGIIASGVSRLVLGSADYIFTHPIPAKGSPNGDGIFSSNKDMILLRGSEGAINSITRGEFSLHFPSKDVFTFIRWSSFLFLIQCITQLLLIQQASLFGQIMFLISLGVSALYNTWVSSLDNEKFHRNFLFRHVLGNPRLCRYTLGTRTSAVVFILLVLQPQDPRGILNELLPNDTKVWKEWKETILEQLCKEGVQSFQFESIGNYPHEFTQQEKDLLAVLFEDARSAYNGYADYLQADSL